MNKEMYVWKKKEKEIITNITAVCWSFLSAKHHIRYSMYTILLNAHSNTKFECAIYIFQ